MSRNTKAKLTWQILERAVGVTLHFTTLLKARSDYVRPYEHINSAS